MKATYPSSTPGPMAGRHPAHLWQDSNGAVAVEYGLIVALIALAILVSLRELGAALLGLPLQSIIDAITGVLS